MTDEREEGEGRFLLLDEPTAALDIAHQHAFLRTAQRLAERGAAVLAIVHDPNLALLYADHIVILAHGRIAARGDPRTVLTPERMRRIFGIDVAIERHPARDRVSALCVVLFAAFAVTAPAADPDVSVELNKLEQMDGACRAYFVLESRIGIDFGTLKLDLVMFDADRIVTRRLAAEVGPLPSGKTSLKVFDMEDLLCAELGRLLLNDVTACADDSGARGDCLALLSTSTRATVPFIK